MRFIKLQGLMITKQCGPDMANLYSSHILAKAHFTWEETSNFVSDSEKKNAFCNSGRSGSKKTGKGEKGF